MIARGLALAALLLVQVGFGTWIVLGGRPSAGEPSVDVAVYYVAARAFAAGKDPYTFTDADWASRASAAGIAAITPPYRYPPLTAAIVGLIAWLPFRAAVAVWMAASVAALAASAVLLSLTLRGRAVDPAVFGLLALFVPALNTLYTGQVNDLVLLGVATYLYLAVSGRAVAAGLALGLAAVVKPIAAPLVLVLLWRRAWRALVGVGLGVAAATIASALLLGPRPELDHLTAAWRLATLSPAAALVAEPANQSLFGLAARLVSADAARPVATALALLLVGGAALVIRRTGPPARALPLEIGLALVTIELVAPVSWYHHLVLASVALLAAWYATGTAGRIVVLLATTAISAHGIVWRALVGQPALLSLATYGLLATYALVAVILWRQPPQRAGWLAAQRVESGIDRSGTTARENTDIRRN